MVLFTVSKGAKGVLDRLQAATGIRSSQWVRVAFGLSLSEGAELPDEKTDSGGSYFHDNVFYGGDKDVFLALLRESIGAAIDEEQVSPYFKRHVERGVAKLCEELDRCGGSGERLVLSLLETASYGSPLELVRVRRTIGCAGGGRVAQ